ncbi:MAG: GTP cyclohydrolase [Bdellovibrionaceae bacterium]|nr:GTP cyclohydrolase [Pseudobdellovibrionaceae bacterium]MBX3033115.1 GTP cyclohydrolase [Pseudobdellovibrionaceae bacterium]
MDKLTRSLSQGFNRFQKRIESLLETEEAAPPSSVRFEVSRDPALVRDLPLGLPEDHLDRAIVLFSRLAGLYDAGVLLENHDGLWRPQAFFRDGQARPLRRDPMPSLPLPDPGPLTALQAPTEALLRRLGLAELDEKNRRRAFLIKPVPDFAYLLLSDLPDLWLKDHLERTVKSLADGFAG